MEEDGQAVAGYIDKLASCGTSGVRGNGAKDGEVAKVCRLWDAHLLCMCCGYVGPLRCTI